LSGSRPARRQDAPKVYVLNGAVYVAQIEWLSRLNSFDYAQAAAYIMPASRSLDIDTEDDLKYFEFILARGGNASGTAPLSHM